jgi:putative oxidoreductase
MLMLTEPHRDLLRDKGTKFGRFLMGFLFVGGALQMLFITTPDNVALYFANLGIPMASLVVWLVILLKLVAGTAIIIGQRVGLASAVLIAFVFIATVLAHSDFSKPNEISSALKNLFIIGGLLYLMAFGPGGSNIKLVRTDTK